MYRYTYGAHRATYLNGSEDEGDPHEHARHSLGVGAVDELVTQALAGRHRGVLRRIVLEHSPSLAQTVVHNPDTPPKESDKGFKTRKPIKTTLPEVQLAKRSLSG